MITDSMRSELVELGAALYDRGLTPGRTGNLSVRIGDEVVITPTGASLGRLDAERLSVLSLEGDHRSGDRPSKEFVLHRALYRNHPDRSAVAHLHSTSAVAVSCLRDLDLDDALPPITPYFVMRVGRLPLVDYAAPGSTVLEDRVSRATVQAHAVLLRNHGTLVAARTLEDAVDAVEEIEETAKLHLLLAGRTALYLGRDDVAELQVLFP